MAKSPAPRRRGTKIATPSFQAAARSDPRAQAGAATGTRSLLMELLKREGESDVASLARELGISGVAVRHHLAALERDGHVAQRSVRRPVGRPARLYRLTEAAERVFPQISDRVALDLLARTEKLMGAEALDRVFRSRLRDLDKHYREKLSGARSWAEKLRVLAEIRDAEGYLCGLEQVSIAEAKGGWRLVEHHCPVADVAKQHPDMCRYELELFKRVLGEPDLTRLEHIRSGGSACRYAVPARPR
jgi:predicted ArsR family transcriptional regulator